MSKKILGFIFILGGLIILNGCSNNTSLTAGFTQGDCPDGVNQAPYCMAVQITNNGGGQTWITSTSFPISGLTIVANGVNNVQTPSTNQSTMDPNNCTNSTLAPGANCTFYLKISFESYSTLAAENINVTMNYTLNNTLFGNSGNTSSSSFTIYEVTNLYATQTNGYVGIYNVGGQTNYYAESFNDPINTAAADTSSYGHLYIGGNVGIYRVGNESGNESSTSSISPTSFSGITTNLFTISSNLYATPGTAVWAYSLSGESWTSMYTLGLSLRPNANAVSPGGVIYLTSTNQVFTCGGTSSTSTCQLDGITTNSGSTPPGTINAIAYPNGGSTPFTGFYIGATGGLFAESGTPGSSTNTWVAVPNSGGMTSITSMVSFNNNLYAGDSSGNIWLVQNIYSGNTPPTATKIATVSAGITAMTVDTIAGVLYFAATSSNTSTLYGCSIANNTCTPDQNNVTLYPVVSLNIASQLVTGY